MTRINVVPVTMLSNKHLMAEYKEITRPFGKVRKHIEAGRKPSDLDIPETYRLGKGHETFFFDKLAYLHCRYIDLFEELKSRRFLIDSNKFELCDSMMMEFNSSDWYKDYTATHEAIYLNMARLARRSGFEDTLEELKSPN